MTLLDNRRLAVGAAVAAAAIFYSASAAAGAVAGWNQTAAGIFDYHATGNWVDIDNDGTGDINGIWDSSLVLAGAQTVTFAADTQAAAGLTFNYGGNFALALNSLDTTAHTLTLGGDISVATTGGTAANITIGNSTNVLNVNLGGATRTCTIGSGRTLSFANVLSDGGITLAGGGTLRLDAANLVAGTTTVNNGTLQLYGGGSIAGSDVTLNNNATFSLTNATGAVTRAQSVTISGAGTLAADESGNAANTLDTVSGALGVLRGAAVVQIRPQSTTAGNAQLALGSLTRSTGATVFFRGTNLGAGTIAGAAAGGSNVSFASAPALIGASGGSGTTIGILAGAYGDISYAGDGAGLVTYDAAKGVRLLDAASEYTARIGDQQTQLDNVRYARDHGETITTTLTNGTSTINSLSIVETGPTNTNGSSLWGVNITGGTGAVLKINSGVIYASQTLSASKPVKADCMLVNVPKLDLNGREGVVIVAATKAEVNSNTKAPLFINSEITNDGGFGLTKGGGGTLQLEGSLQNTYTGDTVVNAGILYLNKAVSNIALPANTNLIVNGGTVYQGSNQIPDTASVTINGGSWQVNGSPDNGSRYAETFTNLTMTGGLFTNGQKAGGSLAILGTANLVGGTFEAVGIKSGTSTTEGSNIVVSGPMAISHGAVVTLGRSGYATSYSSKITLNDGLAITNTASGAYTPISIDPGTATTNGGRIILASDVTFTGNATNGNTTTIDAPAGAGPRGSIAIVGARTFDIGNGAAAADLTLVPSLVDGDSVGSVLKTGGGTLVLSGAGSYTGTTTLSGGNLNVGAAETAGTSGPLGTSGSIVFCGGALQYSGANTYDYSGRFSTSNAQAYSVDTNGQNVTWATPLTPLFDFGSLAKSGAGTLTLSAAGTFTGATAVNGGTLRVTGSIAGTSSVTVLSNAVLDLASVGGTALAPSSVYTPVTNNGTLIVNSSNEMAGAIDGNGTTNVTGNLTADSIVQNTLTIGAGATVVIRETTGGSASSVPEPGTWVLLAAGAVCLLPLLRRLKRRMGGLPGDSHQESCDTAGTTLSR